MIRALGLDLGTKRIGVALSNSAGTLATPYDVVHRSKDRRADHRKIHLLAQEAEAELIVVGLPLHLDGRLSPNARSAVREAEAISVMCSLPVETYDERLTTVTADRTLLEMNLNSSARRKVVDQVAASVMLQAWCDHRLATASSPEESSQ